jgi:release factor glutamine methyltransferase
LAHVLDRSRAWLIAHGEALVSTQEACRVSELCARRAAGVPIAYLLGSAYFYGREFTVNETVLVPRPETERIVDEALAFIGDRPMRVLDVGTGCGAIACTIAAESRAFVDATDSSPRAVELAVENARRLRVGGNCRFHHGNLAEPVGSSRFDLVIANLPYVPTGDLPKPPDPVSYEPREALDGGPDGLDLYRALLRTLPARIHDGGLMLLEAAPPTILQLAALVGDVFSNCVISIGNDYSGLARYVKAAPGRSREDPGN